MPATENTTAEPSPAATSGQNGAQSQSEIASAKLTDLLRQEFQAADEPPETLPAPADDAPPKTGEQASPEEGGETTPEPDENAAPPETGEASSDQVSDDTELNEVLKGLNDDAKAKLIEMAKEVAEGKTTLGELKQGFRLHRKTLERVANLEAKLNGETEESVPNAIAAPVANIPDEVAKLKDLNAVEAHEHKARSAVRQLERVLRSEPDVEGKYKLGEQSFTAEQIDTAIEKWKDDLDAIPKKVAQIQQVNTIQAQRREFRQVFEKDYPWVKDPESQQNKMIREITTLFPELKKNPHGDYLAYCFALGRKAAEAERTGRTNGNGTLPGKVPVKPPGKVPASKPHGGVSSAPAKLQDRTSFNSAELTETARSKDKLLALLGNVNR